MGQNFPHIILCTSIRSCGTRQVQVTINILNAIHDFSVWLITGSNPADINRFRSNTGIILNSIYNAFKAKIDNSFLFR